MKRRPELNRFMEHVRGLLTGESRCTEARARAQEVYYTGRPGRKCKGLQITDFTT